MELNPQSSNEEDDFFGLEQLQEKVALLLTLMAAILMVFLGVSDYFLGLNSFIIFLKLGMSIPFLAGYFLIRRKGYYQVAINILLVVAHVGIFFNYMNNDGYRGPTIYTYFILIVVFNILLRGGAKIAWFCCSLAAYALVFYLEISGQLKVVQNYADVNSLYFDHLITIIWCSLFTFIALYIFVSRYKKQTEKLEQLGRDQKDSLLQIQRINDEKNRLLALLSHDLKNPIGTLSTTLSLVDEGVFETKEIERILSNLKDQSYHLNKVLNNTLSYVLTEIHSDSQHTETRGLWEFSNEIREVMQVQANQKNQKIDFMVKGVDQKVILQVNEIGIILKNLLDNAIKFSEVGATVFFTLEIEGAVARWLVINEGQEIPGDQHEELFKFRVKSSYGTKKEKGTGLGLPLSKKIADANGLILGFESSSFKTVFYLEKEL